MYFESLLCLFVKGGISSLMNMASTLSDPIAQLSQPILQQFTQHGNYLICMETGHIRRLTKSDQSVGFDCSPLNLYLWRQLYPIRRNFSEYHQMQCLVRELTLLWGYYRLLSHPKARPIAVTGKAKTFAELRLIHLEFVLKELNQSLSSVQKSKLKGK